MEHCIMTYHTAGFHLSSVWVESYGISSEKKRENKPGAVLFIQTPIV